MTGARPSAAPLPLGGLDERDERSAAAGDGGGDAADRGAAPCGPAGATGCARPIRRAILALDRVTTGIASVLAVPGADGRGGWPALWQVVARFATETPSVWSEALVRTALIWMAFLGVAVALRAGALVSIDVAHRYSRGALRRAIEAAALACSPVACSA